MSASRPVPRPTLPIYSSDPSVDTLARRFGLSTSKAYAWARKTGLAFDIGGTLRVDPAELDATIARLRVQPEPTPRERRERRLSEMKALHELAGGIVREIRGRRQGRA